MIDCVEFCRALADETRQRILRMLLDQGELCVGDIAQVFAVSQPTVSHHLRVLRHLGLVKRRKEGKLAYYSVDQGRIVECCGRLFAQFDAQEACEA